MVEVDIGNAVGARRYLCELHWLSCCADSHRSAIPGLSQPVLWWDCASRSGLVPGGLSTRSRRLWPLQEPDLVVSVGSSGVCVPGDDERVLQAQLGALQDFRQQVYFSHDRVFVGDPSEAPGTSNFVSGSFSTSASFPEPGSVTFSSKLFGRDSQVTLPAVDLRQVPVFLNSVYPVIR